MERSDETLRNRVLLYETNFATMKDVIVVIVDQGCPIYYGERKYFSDWSKLCVDYSLMKYLWVD